MSHLNSKMALEERVSSSWLYKSRNGVSQGPCSFLSSRKYFQEPAENVTRTVTTILLKITKTEAEYVLIQSIAEKQEMGGNSCMIESQWAYVSEDQHQREAWFFKTHRGENSCRARRGWKIFRTRINRCGTSHLALK